MAACPPPCLLVIRCRPTARCRPRRSRSWGSSRSGSTCTCPSARSAAATATSTPTPPRSWAAAHRGRPTPPPPSRRCASRARCSARCDLPVSTVFFGGGTPTLLSPADLGAVVAAIDAEFGLDRRRRGHHRVEPGLRGRAPALRAARGGVQPGLLRHAVSRRPRAPHARPYPRPEAGAGGRRRSAAGGLRAGEPRPDLRHAGGVRCRLGDDDRGGAGVRARPRVGVLADRRGRHRPGPAGTPRRAADARRGRPRRQVPGRRREVRGGRPGLVRGLQLGPGRRGRCRHNLGYWSGGDWWGVGPGAHSHVGGVRWWNVKHPAAYADRLAAGLSPAHAGETLDAESRRIERVLLEVRLRARHAARRARGRRPRRGADSSTAG